MRSAIASVVVPAHDEETRIRATLETLLADAERGEFEVVVVCNGCSDATAGCAREVPNVTVIEIPRPSKVAALREADRVARSFPRIYLDADVLLSTAAARALVEALRVPSPRVGGITAELDLREASWFAAWYHEFRYTLPIYRHGIIGAGVYALNAEGHRRLGDWPDVVNDDQFVFRSFAPSERITVRGHRTKVTIGGDLATVVRRGVRVRRGNSQLTRGVAGGRQLPRPRAGIGTATARALLSPRSWPGLVTWLLVNALIRVGARLDLGGDWFASDPPRGLDRAEDPPRESAR